jgi:DNA gyrase subunit A
MPKKNQDNSEKQEEEAKPKPRKSTGDKFNIGTVQDQPLVDEMKQSYLDYAMSVIVSRALPDVRDGLKPVHRRILYAMWKIGLRSNAKFRKSATVVGEVLGKYHPHGDQAVYQTMVRMAQDFAMRYPLVKGQGNFGSMDGDNAAAMRYTEAKMAAIAEELLFDIEKQTVDFAPNYDGSHQEPKVFPAKLPALLINGSVGIAVGMATNIAPHNLTEICQAVKHLIKNPDASVDDLMKFVTGPDFPTGATIYNQAEIRRAYTEGKGSIVTRGDSEIVEDKKGYHSIIFSSIPYQVNKSNVLEKIAGLVKDKKLDGIRDLRDESDKDGVRIVVELKRDAFPKKVLNSLYKFTQLQDTFHYNCLALIDGIQPRLLTLKMVLAEYIKHRTTVVVRRAKFELAKAEDRAHILQGLVMALEDIDKIIATIRKSKDKEEAKVNLMKEFKFSERQTVAILEMRLAQLANLERLAVEKELKEKLKLIKELKALLQSDEAIRTVIFDEVSHIEEKYGDERRTKVVATELGKFSTTDLVPNEASIIMLTNQGYIKRLPPDTFKTQRRGGKGVIGLTAKEQDFVESMFTTMTHSDLLFFTSRGRVFKLKAYEVPQASRTAKGQAIVNFLQLAPTERVNAILPMADLMKYKNLVMATTHGLIKKTSIDQFANIRSNGLIAIKLKEDDTLSWIKPSTGKDEIMVVTQSGQAIRFKEKDVRQMGRTAAGVKAIKLKGDDLIAGMGVISGDLKKGFVITVMKNGFGKRTPLSQYRLQSRAGSGIKTAKITPKTGNIIFARIIEAETKSDLMIISKKGQVIRLPMKGVNTVGRATQGVRLMRFKAEGDEVASTAIIEADEEEES